MWSQVVFGPSKSRDLTVQLFQTFASKLHIKDNQANLHVGFNWHVHKTLQTPPVTAAFPCVSSLPTACFSFSAAEEAVARVLQRPSSRRCRSPAASVVDVRLLLQGCQLLRPLQARTPGSSTPRPFRARAVGAVPAAASDASEG